MTGNEGAAFTSRQDDIPEDCTKLNTFTTLNEIEQMFADDNIEAVKELEMSFGPRFSEICAQRGAQKCLDYLIEEGHELSPSINLYRIKRGEKPIPEISHDDELYFALVFGHDELLPLSEHDSNPRRQDNNGRIDRPSVRIAFRTLIRLLRNNAFDMVDYTSKIWPLYLQSSWQEFIGRCGWRPIEFLVSHKMYQFLDGVQPSYRTVKMLARLSSRKRRVIGKHCLLPVCLLTS